MVERANIRLFMTNILDATGPVVIIGEEVIEPVIEVNNDPNATYGVALLSHSDTVELRHPLRLIAHEGTVSVASLFAKEEWVKIPKALAMELSVHDKIKDIFVRYEQEVFCPIIMPEEKKIII